MATISLQEAEVVKTFHGGPPIIVNFPEAATQVYKRGDFVNLVAGKVTLAGTDPTQILGIACADASGVTDRNASVILSTADTVFALNVTTAAVTAQTNLGLSFKITRVSAGKWHLDPASFGTLARMLIVDHDKRDVVGDIQGRLHAIVLSKFRQMDASS